MDDWRLGKTWFAARGWLALWALTLGASLLQASVPRPAAVEPTVTREESEWIHAAVNIAETNAPVAISRLAARITATSSPALDFTVGNLYVQSGQESEAAEAYRRAIEKMPGFRAARVNLARLHLMQDRASEAMTVLRDVTTDGQGDADTYLLLGHALLLTDALVSAETAYRQSLMLRPQDPDALLGLARSLLPQNRPDEVLALAVELTRRDPFRREFQALRANALLALDRSDEAATVLESARRLGVADADMMALLGDLHLNARRIEDAVICYEEAFSGDPVLPRMVRAFEAMLLAGQAEAAARLRDLILQMPQDDQIAPELRRTILRLEGDLALAQGEVQQALDHYTALLRENPLDGRALLRVAELHRAADRLEEATIALERAARLPAVQVDALVLHAQIEVQRERYRHAVTLLEAAQALEPSDRVERYLAQVRRLQAFEAP